MTCNLFLLSSPTVDRHALMCITTCAVQRTVFVVSSGFPSSLCLLPSNNLLCCCCNLASAMFSVLYNLVCGLYKLCTFRLILLWVLLALNVTLLLAACYHSLYILLFLVVCILFVEFYVWNCQYQQFELWISTIPVVDIRNCQHP